MKRILGIIKYIAIGTFIVFFAFYYYQVNASNKLEGIECFPSSYQGYLREISENHPNWKFTALYTNLDWNEVIRQENVFGKNLVPKNYSDNWKNTKAGEYNVEVDKGWVDCSKQALEYCMDPRNFLNEVRIFQFETLSYDVSTTSINGIEKILYGTEFYNKSVSYLDSNGKTISMNEKYSDLILKAAQVSLVSPYHLASRIKQEVGPFLSHNSISGTVEDFEGLYNFYNIGATSSAEVLGAIKNGLQYAKDGKGASEETRSRYLIPWNTKEKAITGGAIFIGRSYINVGQNTIYQQKFDINDDRGSLFWHQYMTNVLAPYSESKIIYNGYKKAELLDTSMSFIIPVYENMPEIPVESPDVNKNDAPEVLPVQKVTEIILDQDEIYIQIGNTFKINGNAYPENAEDKTIIYSALNEEIVSIDQDGNILGLQEGETTISAVAKENPEVKTEAKVIVVRKMEESEISFDSPLKVNSLEISGLDSNQNTVYDIKQKIITELDLEFLNNKNEILADTDLIGTGCKIRVKENEKVLREYKIILYGDINGDGKINGIDLLVLQRHILEIEKIDGVYLKAANVRKTAPKATSIDLLLIQRHILEIQFIEQ